MALRPNPDLHAGACAARSGARAAEEMTYLVSRGIFPMRPTSVVERTRLVRPGKRCSPGWRRSPVSHPASRLTGMVRVSMRPWSLSVTVTVASPVVAGSSKQAATPSCRVGWLRLSANRAPPPPAGTAPAMAGLVAIASMVAGAPLRVRRSGIARRAAQSVSLALTASCASTRRQYEAPVRGASTRHQYEAPGRGAGSGPRPGPDGPA
jgi:hypothetical protein